jgi:hypothetical protein
MLVGKGLYLGSVSTLNGLVLVPFYVSVVPVLSLVFMRELWIWSRNAMRFEQFYTESRPILGFAYAAFWYVANVIFAGCFFALYR